VSIREELIKAIEGLPDDILEGVLEYVHFIREPEEAEPTGDELKAIERGEREFAKGECVRWRDIKDDAL
jgi:hypothetical protein